MDTDSLQLTDLAVQFLKSKKAMTIVKMDLRELTDITDYFVICTAESRPHAEALCDAVIEGMEKAGYPPWHVEGDADQTWVLIDFVDVVVHIFQQDTRQFYALERLWGDARIEEVSP